MKKVIGKILILVMALLVGFTLVACQPKQDNNGQNPPTENNDNNNNNESNENNDENEEDNENNEEDDTQQEEEEDDPYEGYTKLKEGKNTVILIRELKTKDVSSTQKFVLKNHTTFKVELFHGGNYPLPMTIKSIIIDGIEIDLRILELPTKAGENTSGNFQLAGRDIEVKQMTNYQPLRMVSTTTQNSYFILNVENVTAIEIEMVFTTSSVGFFEKVELTFN